MNDEKEKQNDERSLMQRTVLTGFIGGVWLSTLSLLMYYFNFSEITLKSYLGSKWMMNYWFSSWVSNILTILIFGCLSIIITFIYYFLFRKINSLWIGLFYGAMLWVVLLIVLQPLYPQIDNIFQLKLDTILSTLCLFLLYGIFIGYSISYDYYDTIVLGSENLGEDKS